MSRNVKGGGGGHEGGGRFLSALGILRPLHTVKATTRRLKGATDTVNNMFTTPEAITRKTFERINFAKGESTALGGAES